jgi:AraC family transcriptional regulator, regulatory protein of adaptative response / methylated-DNA-[protein]-cysteine methyltransferase
MTCVLQSIDSPLGPLVAVAAPEGVCMLEFGEPDRLEAQMTTVRRLFRTEAVGGENAHLQTLRDELRSYFAGGLTRFSVPVVTPGTSFQQRVWSELLRIPYGETRSYEDVARAVGMVSAPRAVGRANGSNRIAIVVPCHRVVNKDGKLGGYGGQLWRKEALLRLERPSLLR